MKQQTQKILIAAVGVQVVVGWLTLRDLRRRSRSEVLGPRVLWRVWGSTNTFGAFMYWTVGRRRRKIRANAA